MRFHSILISALAAVSLAACVHEDQSTSAAPVVTLANANSVSSSSSSGVYAVTKPIPSGATIKPSSECAEGFDDVVSYLEHLMKQKQGQQVASANTAPATRVSKRIEY